MSDASLHYVNADLSRADSDLLWEDIRREVSVVVPVEPPPLLYHYTDIEGLLAILDSQVLRLSHAAYLNDASELSHGLDVIKEVVESKKGQFGQQYGSLIQLGADSLRGLYEGAFDPYVFSLSEPKDMLSQWRAYGKASGVAIGFDTNKLKELALEKPSLLNITSLSKVIYEKRDQSRLVEVVIDAVHAYEGRTNSAKRGGTSLLKALVNAFVQLVPTFKHPSFSEEQEWRVIRLLASHPEPELEFVHHRIGGRLLIPYINLKAPTGQLGISEVVCGPHPNPELVIKAVSSCLKKRGYAQFNILKSRIPFRSD